MISDLTAKLATSGGAIADLEGQAVAATNAKKLLQGEIAKRKSEAQALSSRAQDLSSQITLVRQALAAEEKLVTGLEEKYASANQQLGQLGDERADLRRKLADGEKKLVVVQRGLRSTERLATQRASELTTAADNVRRLERSLKATTDSAEGLATQRLVLGVLLVLAIIVSLWGWLKRPKAALTSSA